MFILKILYNLTIAAVVPIAVPVGYIIALKRKEDEDYFQRFGMINFPEPTEKSIWFHCASVGEVRSLKSALEYIRTEFPDIDIIISTTTATGKRMANAELEPYFAFLLPLENSMAIDHIIDYMNVKAVFIVDTELWPNMIRIAAKRSKLYLLNGRISDKTFENYKRFSFLFRRLLSKFEIIFTKSDEDTDKFATIKGDKNNIVTMGNIKFQSRAEKIDSGIFNFIRNHRIFAAASTHAPEEETIIKAFVKQNRCDRMVLAPRHINRAQDAVKMCREYGLSASLLAERDGATDVVVIDRFGTLEELFIFSEKVFIGGSLNDTGGHNIFEALQFEKITCTGPNMKNFQEISELADKYGVRIVVENEEEFAEFLDNECEKADFDGFFEALDSDKASKLEHIKEVLSGVSDN